MRRGQRAQPSLTQQQRGEQCQFTDKDPGILHLFGRLHGQVFGMMRLAVSRAQFSQKITPRRRRGRMTVGAWYQLPERCQHGLRNLNTEKKSSHYRVTASDSRGANLANELPGAKAQTKDEVSSAGNMMIFSSVE